MTTNAEDNNSVHDDLREVVAAASTAPEAPTQEPTAPEASDPPPAAKTSDRDIHGRFKTKEDVPQKDSEPPTPEKILEAGAAVAGRWSIDKPPTSWGPKSREKWAELPEEIRREVIKREESAVLGVRHLSEKHAPVEAFHKALEPFIVEAKRGGVVPEQYIGNVMTTERILRTADLPTKFQTILGIARQYGVPLDDIINKSVGQEVLKTPKTAAPAIHPEVARELSDLRKWRQDLSAAQVGAQISGFSSDAKHEFFEDVRHTMADLIDMGRAQGLEDAYEQAVWMHPEVREIMLGRQQQAKGPGLVAKRQVAAAGASMPSKGSVVVDEGISDDDDLYNTVRKVATGLNSGRM